MPPSSLMSLQILLPFQDSSPPSPEDVSRVVAETLGRFRLDLLPHRLDCVAALVPGILVYAKPTAREGEVLRGSSTKAY